MSEPVRFTRAEDGSKDLEPLQWRHFAPFVVVRCRCGFKARLDHEISAAGVVSPSVNCPECDFHESGVILADWELE